MGATTPHLYQRDVTEFPIYLPPLPEQHCIVAILDEAFAKLATATANAEKISKALARCLIVISIRFLLTQVAG